MSVCRTVGRCVCQYNPTDDTVYTSPTPTAESLRVTLLTSCCAIRKHSFQFRASHHPGICVCVCEREGETVWKAGRGEEMEKATDQWVNEAFLWSVPLRRNTLPRTVWKWTRWGGECLTPRLSSHHPHGWLTPTTSCLQRVTSRLSLPCLTDVCQMLFLHL